MSFKINWVNTNIERQDDAYGNWISSEGRFQIFPNYRSTVYPDSYQVSDNLKPAKVNFETVQECKAWAVSRAQATVDSWT